MSSLQEGITCPHDGGMTGSPRGGGGGGGVFIRGVPDTGQLHVGSLL